MARNFKILKNFEIFFALGVDKYESMVYNKIQKIVRIIRKSYNLEQRRLSIMTEDKKVPS
jgi:hypothetical protein